MLPKLHYMSEMFVASPDICQMQSWQACRSWDMAQQLWRTWVFCREHFLHKILGRWRSILVLAVWWKRQWGCPQWKGAKWRNTSWISWFFLGLPCNIVVFTELFMPAYLLWTMEAVFMYYQVHTNHTSCSYKLKKLSYCCQSSELVNSEPPRKF